MPESECLYNVVMVLHPMKVRQSVFIIDTRVFESTNRKKMARETERRRRRKRRGKEVKREREGGREGGRRTMEGEMREKVETM